MVRGVHQALLSIGSNVAPEVHVPRALAWLDGRFRVCVVSPVYRCPSVGGRPDDPEFLNLAVGIETTLPPRALREVCRRVEDVCGRRRTADRYAPRTLDVDLVLYDDVASDFGGFVLPDPQLLTAAFVLVPAADAWPDHVPPGADRTLADLVAALPEADRASLVPVRDGAAEGDRTEKT